MTDPAPASFTVSLDGYTDLPPGRIANVVTFLERTEPLKEAVPPPGVIAIRRVPEPDAGWFRDLYREIGEQWLWFSRAVMSDTELGALLTLPSTSVIAAARGGRDVGLAELSKGDDGSVEIVTFGVVPSELGTGAAHALMSAVLREAFKPGVPRVWLHTCTFDHPRALPFYRRWGFRPYKLAIEVSEDPRALGALPETVAPHVPFLPGTRR